MGTVITSDHDPALCHKAAKARAELIDEIRELYCKYESGQYYTYPNYSELSERFKREYLERGRHGPTCCCHKKTSALMDVNLTSQQPLKKAPAK